MTLQQIVTGVVVVIVTIIAGLSDAAGAVHAARVWQDGRVVWGELLRSALGFGVAITLYWVVVRFMQQIGLVSAEMQTVVWFGIMLVGVALFSGEFFKWQRFDQALALLVLGGIVWLTIRTGG
jgi:hypothetical protein